MDKRRHGLYEEEYLMKKTSSVDSAETFNWQWCEYEDYIAGYKLYKLLKAERKVPTNKYLARFTDEDVYSMLYLYHLKGESLEALERRFSIGQAALLGFLEGRYRRECYKSFKVVEKILQGREWKSRQETTDMNAMQN